MQTPPLLKVEKVDKGYATAAGPRAVLRDINLTVAEGEFVCIVGYSGAGKTTLINMIAGLLKPDTGAILVDGVPVTGPSLDRALIFQNYSLLPWMTALSNVELAIRPCFPKADRHEVRERAVRSLEKVKLGHALDRRPTELSGGMRQRVSLARGLAMEPRLLLLDEPLGALDALTRAELQDEFMRLRSEEQRTMLMITNDVDEAIILADRIIPLSAGPGATLGDPLTVSVPRPRARREMNRNSHYHHDRKAILHYLLSHGPHDVAPVVPDDASAALVAATAAVPTPETLPA